MARQESQSTSEPPFHRRERPWLLPHNRKLRHLQGITIRNLTVVQSHKRPRGRTIDDQDVALKSPTKALALRESKKLGHARSSVDLRTISESAVDTSQEETERDDGRKSTTSRPSFKLRRRSTMDWSEATPLARQKKLEDVVAERMVDAFFSVHVPGYDEPAYVSETAEQCINPTFRFFDLHEWGPAVTRLDELTVKVWAKTERMAEFQYLLDFSLNLRSLQFIGKTLGNFHHPLPANCILFHLTDGVYTTLTDLPADDSMASELPAQPTSNRAFSSSSYDALLRLQTLDDCVNDAMAAQATITSQINSILNENKERLSTVESVPESQARVKSVEQAVSAQRRQLEAVRRRRDDLRVSLDSRKQTMAQSREDQQAAEHEMQEADKALTETRSKAAQTAEEARGQRRRVCEDLSDIYPIEPIPNRSLAFTICGLPLPNSTFDDVKEDIVSAALGHVAQVLHSLSTYLSVPLPYPVSSHGSKSTVQDPISMTTGSRVYPLFMKGATFYRFEYGVFLLNKNIEILSNELGLKILDIRQTLPNLKYLLYIATAGKGELPARKAGGIRALLRKPGDTPLLSRAGSEDSNASAAPALDVPRRRVEEEAKEIVQAANGTAKRENGKPVEAKGKKNSVTLQASRLRDVV